ncbi:MAG: Cna B-type domain-containing protein [Oscillospiraceae bacterium]|nr:Cna B-type domain-containing protein [Oscillospiraceae bacterium]
MNTDEISTSDSQGSSTNDQLRVSGSYPVGTQTTPVIYTLTLTKPVTFTSKTGATYTVTMSFVATFAYWDTGDTGTARADNGGNQCPGVYTQSGGQGGPGGQGGSSSSTYNSAWTSGSFLDGSGLDFVISTSAVSTAVVIQKTVYDADTNTVITGTDVEGKTYTFNIYSTNGTTTTSDDTLVKTVTLTVDSSGIAYGMFLMDEEGTYYIVETSTGDTVGELTYDHTTTSTDGTTFTTGTTSASSATNATFYVNNYYAEKTTEVKVSKTWSGTDSNQPTSVTVNLLADGAAAKDADGNTVAAATLSAENNWTHTFTNLPVTNSSGGTIAYTVTENAVEGYTTEITGSASEGYTITNTRDTGTLTLKKAVNADSSVDTRNMTFTFYVRGASGELVGYTSISGTVSGTTHDYTVDSTTGVATINNVPADGTVTLTGLPTGTYVVWEGDSASADTTTANGYSWIISDNGGEGVVTTTSDNTVTITNTVKYTGKIVVTKNWEDFSDQYGTRPDSITVTLTGTGSDQIECKYTYTADVKDLASTDVWEFDISDVEFFDTNGNAITYTVTETMTWADGSSYTYTTTYSVDNLTTDEVTPGTDISTNRNVTITNTLKTGKITVSKEVVTAGTNSDAFTIGLVAFTYDESTGIYSRAYDENGDAITYTYTVSSLVGWSHTFDNLPLGYYWSISEWTNNDDGVHSYDMSIIINGTDYSSAVRKEYNSSNKKWTNIYRYLYLDETNNEVTISMTNTEEEVSVDLTAFLDGTKTLTGSMADTDSFTFDYTVYDSSETLVATGTSTVNKANAWTSAIEWTVVVNDAFTYSEVGTYSYVIYETVTTQGGIVWDSTRYTLTITVSEDEDDGHLIATASMTVNKEVDGKRVTTAMTTTGGETSILVADYENTVSITDSFSADFTNQYNVDKTSLIFRATKSLTGRDLAADEFTVTVTEYTDETYSTTGDEDGDSYITIERSNGTVGYMGFTVTYTKAGTYYYTITENSGTKNGVEYDKTTYYVKVVVAAEDNGNGTAVLTVTSATYTTDLTSTGAWTNLFESSGTSSVLSVLTFSNTYTDEVTVSLNNIVSKTLTGRTLVADEFTFLLVPEGDAGNKIVPDGATVATADDPYVEAGYVTVGQWYIEATNAADGSISFGSITYDQSQVGTYTYKVIEVVGTLNGVTYDTTTTGKLIYVIVSYDSTDNKLVPSVSTSALGNTSVTIANTFDPGTVDLYGTKVWVDGNLSHDNKSEITLTVYKTSKGIDQDAGASGTWLEVDSSTYTVTWFEDNDWHIAGTGLTKYDAYGYKITYKVEETVSVNGETYIVSYATEDGVIPSDNAYNNRYTITNTLEQDEVVLSGAKTWVDGGMSHDNESEITLIVTRNSDSTELKTLTQATDTTNGDFVAVTEGAYSYNKTEGYYYLDENGTYDAPADGTYIVVWEDTDNDGTADTYSIYWYRYYDTETQKFVYVGLNMYDDARYAYVYQVAEELNSDNQMTVTIGGVDYTYTGASTWGGSSDEYTWNLTNTRDSEEPTIEKTETEITDENDNTEDAKVDDENSTDTETWYQKTAAGDTITYQLDWYNGYNTAVTVTITDTLDVGVEYVVASATGDTDESTETGKTAIDSDKVTNEQNYVTYTLTTDANGRVTAIVWTIYNAQPFATGTVTFQVTVTEDAREVSSGETTATVENSATMTVFGNDYETGTVVNPLEDDDPSDPLKLLRAAYYYEETDNGDGTTTTTVEDRETVDDKGNLIVHPGDILVYYIYYTNNLATTATVTIVDQLDEGVSYVNSSYGGTYDAATHTVTWGRTVPAFDTVEVTLWVQVDDSEEAKNAENTYEIGQDKDESGEYTTDYALTYGVDENTTASVSNQASVTVNEVTTYTDVTDNPLGDDDPEAPAKTETSTITSETTDASTGEVTTETKDNSGAVDDKTLVDERTDEQANDTTIIAVDELTSSDAVTYSDVAVGDIVTYNISYYNHFSSTATITIEDELDEGVDFVAVLTGTEKTDTLTAPTETNPVIYELTVENVTDENGDTVTRVTKITWTILAEPLTRGSVSFQAIVNETAMEMEAEETVATVENDADVTITSAETSNTVKQTTNTVENPLEDDDPEDPVKTETTVDGSSDPTITTDGDGVDTYEYDAVGVGETITYTISYYNHHNSTATLTIEDVLDDGVDYVEGTASDDGVYDENTRTVTWTLTVAALTRGTVSFQVMVNEDAKTVTSTETVATVDNQATVINSEDTEVGHKYSTNIVTNPIDPDDPSDPQKFVSTSSEAGVNGATVTVGDHITYVITYYNHTNQTATVIIEDALIDGVTYVSATNDGAYSASKHTVTWTIEDVAPYTGGIVYLTVEVTEDAQLDDQVQNYAVDTIGDHP